MQWTPGSSHVLYALKPSHEAPRELFPPLGKIDALEFLARVLTQLSEPRRHSLFYYVHDENVVRGRRQSPRAAETGDFSPKETEELESHPFQAGFVPALGGSDSTSLRVRPLLCPCGGTLRLVAFIAEPRVLRKILHHLHYQPNAGRGPSCPPTGPFA
jgi:hypothetical protein